uniref:Uncharacterized protein n=1 Tax=Manihot esculenta TaxID=3983 RepID=A0A2C9U9B3_MANES
MKKIALCKFYELQTTYISCSFLCAFMAISASSKQPRRLRFC